MSTPFGDSSSAANVDINDGIQPTSRSALSTAVVAEDGADEPPCSGKQAPQLSLTLSQDSASTPTAAASTQPPESLAQKPKEHDFACNIDKFNPKIEAVDTPKRKIRFKVPLTLPRLSKRSRLRALFTPTRPIGPPPSYGRSIINIFRFSPLNVLLAFIPISWALHFAHQPNAVVFATSALSILPLAALLGFVTEQVAIRTSSAVAALLNASLGNLTELIIAGICLSRCQLQLVQTTLLGGLLSNLLLVLGMAFVVGGFRYPQLSFRPAAAQVNASLLTVGVIAMLVPTAFHNLLGGWLPDATVEGPMLLQMSRGYSVILMFIYCCYLGFQLYTHSHLFLDTNSDSDTDSHHGTWGGSSSSSGSSASSVTTARSRRSSRAPTTATAVSHALRMNHNTVVDEEIAAMPIDPISITRTNSLLSIASDSSADMIYYPLINTPAAATVLVTITAIMYLTAENLVDSLTALTDEYPNGISREFLSLIVLPVLSNGAELSTAVYAGYKGKFDLVLGVAVGSCIQITLFVIPFLVCVAWGLGKPLSLLFDPLEISCLFLTVLLVKFVIEDGRTHWLNGFTLVCVYVLIASTFWHFPTSLMGVLGGNQTLFVCIS